MCTLLFTFLGTTSSPSGCLTALTPASYSQWRSTFQGLSYLLISHPSSRRRRVTTCHQRRRLCWTDNMASTQVSSRSIIMLFKLSFMGMQLFRRFAFFRISWNGNQPLRKKTLREKKPLHERNKSVMDAPQKFTHKSITQSRLSSYSIPSTLFCAQSGSVVFLLLVVLWECSGNQTR